ncbi:multidrug ABC transporter permease [Lentzea sp. NBRC 105346]|uniref:ABC transporter ATP-binding protein n=1 Tax=Lentzea sp. NBRC 105346 TaxID=3032205 RepID=UPI0024A5B987|nr:ATP-binding cassette domain-containing protein [Lentzea sp. NBRC 105346]GLZ33773.1 multidrug ABC transporter permease [Lentzea sp. NBRC 105346]
MDDRELHVPYWQLEQTTAPRRVVRDLPRVTGPVLSMIWAAAPRPALVVLVLQVASGLFAAFGLFATTDVLTSLLTGGVGAALPSVLVVGAAFGLRGLMDIGVALSHARITPAVRRVAEERLYRASLGVELAAFDDAAFYDKMHRARDRGLFYLERSADNLVELIGSLLGIVAAAGSLTVLHPLLLPVLLLAVLPDGWAVQRSAQLAYVSAARAVTLDRRVQMVSSLATEREPAAEIRACQAEPFVLAEYRDVADPLRDEDIRRGVAQARVRGAGRAMAGAGLAVTYLVLGLMVHGGWVALAVAGTAVIAIRATTTALNRFVLAANQLVEQGMYVGDYLTFLEAARSGGERAVDGSAGPELSDPSGRVENGGPPGGGDARVSARASANGSARGAVDSRRVCLERVTFTYPESGTPALRDVSLAIEPGQTIALVGENGSGKTTLAKLIAGLYSPTQGHVRWDGHDLRDLNRASVADKVMMVLQDPIRWPHTARANVRVGRHDRRDPGDLALTTAAMQSGADDVVNRLPKHWETLLSKQFRGGLELSGGQWQRLAVARGLFRDAPLLIWDEPTAPLDAKAEFAVYESLRTLAEERTVVLITHRLASVRHADRIYLLHEGELAEQGTHDELVQRRGRYAELHDLQARMYADA